MRYTAEMSKTLDTLSSESAPFRLTGLRRQTKIQAPNGMVFHCVDHREIEGMYREIFEEGVYAQEGIQYHDGMTIFDVGANIGMFASYVNRFYPSAKIYCFEPLPLTFKALQANAKEHGFKHTQLNKYGLSDKAGSATFTFFPHSPGWSTMHHLQTPEFMKVVRSDIRNYDRLPPVISFLFKVPVVGSLLLELIIHYKMKKKEFVCPLKTLSSCMKEFGVERIDLLKVDVERAEFSVLKGIQDPDWKKIQQCVIEVQNDLDPQNGAKITQLLKEKGFHVVEKEARYLIKEDGKSYNSTLYATRKA
jgi:FkbM family methyltransferase